MGTLEMVENGLNTLFFGKTKLKGNNEITLLYEITNIYIGLNLKK